MSKPLPSELQSYVALLEPGDPVSMDGIQFYPLHRREVGPEPDVALLEEVEPGSVKVEETSQVSELDVVNDTDLHVLLLEGDIVEGGRQNRVINATFVIEPRSKVRAPTSCIEQGRWGASKGEFKSTNSSVSPRVRSKLKRSVSCNTTRSGGKNRSSDQSAVWETTTETMSETCSYSPTSDHMEVYRKKAEELQKKTRVLRETLQRPEVVGVAVTRGDGRAAIEAFGSPRIAHKVLERILRSHLLYTKDTTPHSPVKELLYDVQESEGLTVPGHMGVGEDVRMQRDRMSASAFLFQGATVHLSADWEEPAAA